MEYAEVARARSERGELVLRRRWDPDAPESAPAVLELRVNGVFVMDTFETTSEAALARAALEMVTEPRRVLVGGLGLGFTAHEVLADLRVEEVTVAEVEPALVGWLRDGTVPHGPLFLADHRLHVVVADVRQVVAEAGPGHFDLALLDVDNGPDFLVHEANAELYTEEFLTRVAAALRPRGVLAVWSSTRSEALADALRAVFGSCVLRPCPVVLQGRDDTYWLHSARLPLTGVAAGRAPGDPGAPRPQRDESRPGGRS
jgi:spermidine synthase